MKIKTSNGESLRSEYTALECAAIKYAVSNQLADGSTFVGVPDATEERYRNCKDVFKVDTTVGGRVIMCEQLAKALGVPFYYQNTVITKFDVIGYKNAAGDFEVSPRYVSGYVDKNNHIHDVAIDLRCVW